MTNNSFTIMASHNSRVVTSAYSATAAYCSGGYGDGIDYDNFDRTIFDKTIKDRVLSYHFFNEEIEYGEWGSADIRIWCIENCEGIWLEQPDVMYYGVFSFELETDAVAFKLRWI